jgi:hypothetical protein
MTRKTSTPLFNRPVATGLAVAFLVGACGLASQADDTEQDQPPVQIITAKDGRVTFQVNDCPEGQKLDVSGNPFAKDKDKRRVEVQCIPK